MTPRTSLHFLCGIAGGLACVSGVGAFASGAIDYAGDALSVRVERMTADDILAAIAERTGAEVRGRAIETNPVSADFESIPLSEALHRLLGTQNFTLVYDDRGKLKTIRLYGGPLAPPPSAVPEAARHHTSLYELPTFLDGHPPIPIDGPLAAALGKQEATFRELFDATLHQSDANVRSEAARVLFTALEGDDNVRQSTVESLDIVNDNTLLSMVRKAAGGHTQEFLTNVTRFTHDVGLRGKANNVLQLLLASRPGG